MALQIKANGSLSENKQVLLVASLMFILVTSFILLSPAQASTGNTGSGSYFLEIDDDSDLLKEEKIHGEVRQLLESKDIQRQVPPVRIKTYSQSDEDTIESIEEEYRQAAEEENYKGVLVFYIRDEASQEEALIAHSFSSQLPKKKLDDLRDRTAKQLGGYRSATEAIGNLAKSIALASTGVEDKQSTDVEEERDNEINLFVKKEVGRVHEGTLLLSCAGEEIEISPTSITEQGQRYRFTFELSEEQISTIESAGCQLGLSDFSQE